MAIQDDLLFVADYSGLVHCLNARSGHVHWTYDMFAACWGTPMIANGHVYVGDEDGKVAVFQIAPGRQESDRILPASVDAVPVAENVLASSVYTTPVVANGVLYVADRSRLYAIAYPQAAPGKSSKPAAAQPAAAQPAAAQPAAGVKVSSDPAELLQALVAEQFAVRESAYRQLLTMGRRAAPSLFAFTREAPPGVQRRRVECLLAVLQRPRILHRHHAAVHTALFSSSGEQIISTSNDHRFDPGAIRILDARSGQILGRLASLARPLVASAISPDGNQFVVGGDDRLITIWNLEKEQKLHQLSKPRGSVWGLDFSPDGRMLAIATSVGQNRAPTAPTTPAGGPRRAPSAAA